MLKPFSAHLSEVSMRGISLSEKRDFLSFEHRAPGFVAAFIRTVPTETDLLFDVEVVGLREQRIEGIQEAVEAIIARDIAAFVSPRLGLLPTDPRRTRHTGMHLSFQVDDGVVRSASYEYRRPY